VRKGGENKGLHSQKGGTLYPVGRGRKGRGKGNRRKHIFIRKGSKKSRNISLLEGGTRREGEGKGEKEQGTAGSYKRTTEKKLVCLGRISGMGRTEAKERGKAWLLVGVGKLNGFGRAEEELNGEGGKAKGCSGTALGATMEERRRYTRRREF